MNSKGFQISISSWIYNLSSYFERILILAEVSCSVKVLLERERGIYYKLVRIVVRLDVLVELLVLVVRTIVRGLSSNVYGLS